MMTQEGKLVLPRVRGIEMPYGVYYRGDPVKRFWSRVDIRGENECWPWLGFIKENGYGYFSCYKKMRYTHRVAYILTYGFFDLSLQVCHSCDNPPCCNPAHLWLGSQKDNIQDCIKKGRDMFIGERNGGHILSTSSVNKIRTLLAEGYEGASIAKLFNVSQAAISRIKNNHAWHEAGASPRTGY